VGTRTSDGPRGHVGPRGEPILPVFARPIVTDVDSCHGASTAPGRRQSTASSDCYDAALQHELGDGECCDAAQSCCIAARARYHRSMDSHGLRRFAATAARGRRDVRDRPLVLEDAGIVGQRGGSRGVATGASQADCNAHRPGGGSPPGCRLRREPLRLAGSGPPARHGGVAASVHVLNGGEREGTE